MSDAELIARLRDFKKVTVWEVHDAADRIEALVNEAVLSKAAYEGVSSLLLSVQQDCIKERQRAERLEAKMAKAVEGLLSIDALDPEALIGGCSREALGGLVNLMGDKARATLAEIKLQSSEFATQKGESHE